STVFPGCFASKRRLASKRTAFLESSTAQWLHHWSWAAWAGPPAAVARISAAVSVPIVVRRMVVLPFEWGFTMGPPTQGVKAPLAIEAGGARLANTYRLWQGGQDSTILRESVEHAPGDNSRAPWPSPPARPPPGLRRLERRGRVGDQCRPLAPQRLGRA